MKQIVESLKLERLRLGLTLEDISRRTGISIGTLHDLENGDFARFPDPPHLTDIIEIYSRTLGIHVGKRPSHPLTIGQDPSLQNELQKTRFQLIRWRRFALLLLFVILGGILALSMWLLREDIRNLQAKKPASVHQEEASLPATAEHDKVLQSDAKKAPGNSPLEVQQEENTMPQKDSLDSTEHVSDETTGEGSKNLEDTAPKSEQESFKF